MGTDNYTFTPESVLPKYDIVFAKAKSVIEALAVGNSVIMCDCLFGVGKMVTTENFERSRSYNFGKHLLSKPFDEAIILKEIGRYSPADSRKVMKLARSKANLKSAADKLIELYYNVIADADRRKRSKEV